MASSESVEIPLQPTVNLRELFDRVDTDNDGTISYMELWQFLREDAHGLPKPVCRKIHEHADRNDDGTLNYNEFVRMVHDARFNTIFDKYLNSYMKVLLPLIKKETVKGRGFDVADGLYEESYSCWPPRICMIIVSLLEIVLFAIDALKGRTDAFGPIAWQLIFNPRRRREAWRFLTYMFVHAGLGHLLVNVTVQLLLGIPLEMVHKWWRILAVYLFGVLAGSLGSSLVDSHSWLAGASGGVYALMTAHIASIILNWREMLYPIAQLSVFLVVILTDVGVAIYNRYSAHEGETVSYAAHFFGAMGGLLMGIIILKNLNIHKHEKIIKYISICIISLFVSIAVVYNFTADSHFPKQDV